MNHIKYWLKSIGLIVLISQSISFSLPEVITHPATQTVLENEAVNFTIVATGDDLTYQWQKDSTYTDTWVDIQGEVTNIMSLANTALADSGQYRCIATDSTGSDTSDVAVLTVTDYLAPGITIQPASIAVNEGNGATFSIVATGTNITYQWMMGTDSIAGATDASYNIAAVAMADSGSYTCVVANDSGSVTSDAAVLTIDPSIWVNWQYSYTFELRTDSAWANLAEGTVVTGFPVLIQLDSTLIDFSQVMDSARDLRFSDATQNKLSHQIESWDITGGTAAVWVLVDTITGNTVDEITMYWGNTSAEIDSSFTAVFDSSDGYLGVWHLDEGLVDATGNNPPATNRDTRTVPGLLGNAQEFPGTDNFVNLGTDSLLMKTDGMSVSAWIKQTAPTTGVISILRQDQFFTPLQVENDGVNAHSVIWTTASPTNIDFTWGGNYDDGAWHHVASEYDPATGTKVYIDGMLVVENTATTGPLVVPASSTGFTLGGTAGGGEPFGGIIDEVKIAGTSRSPEWYKLTYENQRPNQRLIAGSVAPGCVEAFSVAADTLQVNEVSAFTLAGTSTCALRAGWFLVNGNAEVDVIVGNTLSDSIGRITQAEVRNYRFKALFESGEQQADVVVIINETIPDPEFTLTWPLTEPWDGENRVSLNPDITNLTEMENAGYAELNYVWTETGNNVGFAYTALGIDLTRAYGSGETTMELCLDNGGLPTCHSVSFTSAVVSVLDIGLANHEMISFNGASLIWAADARIRIWAVDGTLLFSEIGSQGKKLMLTPARRRLITSHRHLVRIEAVR